MRTTIYSIMGLLLVLFTGCSEPSDEDFNSMVLEPTYDLSYTSKVKGFEGKKVTVTPEFLFKGKMQKHTPGIHANNPSFVGNVVVEGGGRYSFSISCSRESGLFDYGWTINQMAPATVQEPQFKIEPGDSMKGKPHRDLILELMGKIEGIIEEANESL
jgi:hypothetical protein